MSLIINVAKDFSRYPAGRYKQDGPFSGEAFREDFLLPALEKNENIIIDLDGTRGYGSSFLEEAFGGLVRKGVPPDKIKKLIGFKTSDNSIKEEILDYIENQVESQ